MFFRTALAVLLSLATSVAMAAVDVNTASEADLDSIKGVGPSTSGKMLEQRKSAKFKDWADLIERVPGIGEKRAAKLSAEGLTVNGTAFKASTATKAPAKPAAKEAAPKQ
jgi:competence protein ComEA